MSSRARGQMGAATQDNPVLMQVSNLVRKTIPACLVVSRMTIRATHDSTGRIIPGCKTETPTERDLPTLTRPRPARPRPAQPRPARANLSDQTVSKPEVTDRSIVAVAVDFSADA